MSNKQNEKGQGTDLHHILMLTKHIAQAGCRHVAHWFNTFACWTSMMPQVGLQKSTILMTNRTATLNLKKMVVQHSRDLFGMKNLVTTMILHLDSTMMELLVSLSLVHQNLLKPRLILLVMLRLRIFSIYVLICNLVCCRPLL